jgi:hypothetical protein
MWLPDGKKKTLDIDLRQLESSLMGRRSTLPLLAQKPACVRQDGKRISMV